MKLEEKFTYLCQLITVKPRCTDTRYTDNLDITMENVAPKI